MTKRIVFDGFNLALAQGTGIATYSRMLTATARELGHDVSALYSTRRAPSKDPMMREIGFFDERRRSFGGTRWSDRVEFLRDLTYCQFPARPVPLETGSVVITRHFEGRLPQLDHQYVAQNTFMRAHMRFDTTGGFLPIVFDTPPDIMHCTYQMPLRARGALNIYTIHDLVALRLPFTTLDRKRKTLNLLRKVGREADHIVTVSESSRRDIIALLGVEEKRVTNTYQAVSFPDDMLARGKDEVAEQLSGSFGLDYQDYLLFFGAFEPKKNIGRIIDAYLASGVDIPLVIVTAGGWENEVEAKLLAEQARTQKSATGEKLKRRIIRFEYVTRAMLVTLIRGARALLFPSLYEGFGLPVLEAMTLGTPVVTARSSSLTEVAGEAALLVDPYDTTDIARAITAISRDADLRADLIRRGHKQAELFSPARYRERVSALYDGLG